jgi:DNA-binding MurR/RpiR family transcriptional regulator
MSVTGNGHSLEDRIAAVFPRLSGPRRKLARFVLDNDLFVAFASAGELGEQVGVSAATVVRFCQTLGYEGYPDFQLDVRATIPTYLRAVQQLEKGDGKLSQDQLADRVFDLDAHNIRRTAEMLPSDRFKAAVVALAGASDVLVVGSGLSSAPVIYLSHSLNVMGIDSRAVTGGGIPLAAELVKLKPSSVLVAFSVWRYVAETVRAMERAAAAGATRIAISDSVVSPLAQGADFAFQVATPGAAHSLSITAAISLVNAFVAALASVRPEETARALRAIDSAYREGKLVIAE